MNYFEYKIKRKALSNIPKAFRSKSGIINGPNSRIRINNMLNTLIIKNVFEI